MKKFILTVLALSLITFASIAQTRIPTFRGIEISGDASAFVDKLKSAGFSYVKEYDGLHYLKGSFAGFKDCEIIVLYTAGSKQVAKVVVHTPDYSSWYSLRGDYDDIKEMFVKKYSSPDSDYHFFSPPYKLGDGYETTAVKMDKCHYLTIWNLYGYTVGVIITKNMRISISYENDRNMKAYSTEKESSIIEDI